MVESVMVDILAERSASTPGAKPAGTRLGDPTLARGLQIVSALLNAEVARMRASGIPVGENEYRGLYISEPDVDRLLGTPRRAVRDNTAVAQDDRFSGPRTELAQLAASAEGPLGRIVCLANLGPFEVEAINVTHSIPEPVALAIKCPLGKVIGAKPPDCTRCGSSIRSCGRVMGA